MNDTGGSHATSTSPRSTIAASSEYVGTSFGKRSHFAPSPTRRRSSFMLFLLALDGACEAYAKTSGIARSSLAQSIPTTEEVTSVVTARLAAQPCHRPVLRADEGEE